MIGRHFSLILLPTNKCNVACEYCFENKTNDFMSHEQLSIVIDKLLDHMERKAIAAMTIYWQGGEIMLLPPAWFERAWLQHHRNRAISSAMARCSSRPRRCRSADPTSGRGATPVVRKRSLAR